MPIAASMVCTLVRASPSRSRRLSAGRHARRQFFELADIAKECPPGRSATAISPIALAAVQRIDALFDIERAINGLSADERRRVRSRKRVHRC